MANHLTPEELAKETGIDRDEVVRICVEEGVPDLPRQDRQDPLPGDTRGGRDDSLRFAVLAS